jgi:hypothetical protein
LEVEKKSATPYSSKRARKGPEELKNPAFSSLLSPPSAVLDLNGSPRRIDKATGKRDDKNGQE